MINSPIVFADKNYIYLQKISVKVVKLDDLQNEGKIITKAKCHAFMSIPKRVIKSPFSYTLAKLMMARF